MSHSTFVVAQGRIVKARVYDIRSPNGLGRMPLARLVFEVPGQRPGQAQYYLPVIVQGETAMEVQAFLEASGGTPSEAIAQGNLVLREGKAEVHAHRVSFLVTGEDRAQAVTLLRERQPAKPAKKRRV